MNKRLLIVPVVVGLASFALAACGGSSSSSTTTAAATTPTTSSTSSGGGSTVSIKADPSGALAFEEKNVTTTAGNDTIEFDNASSTPHNVQIEDSSGADVAGTDTISGSQTSTTADLKPGTYTFYCSIPGHRDAGMEGTITVK